MSQRIDVHEEITNRIITAIEQGTGEFKLPWHRPAGSITRPTNIQSKKAYRGINVVTLWVEAQLKGYAVITECQIGYSSPSSRSSANRACSRMSGAPWRRPFVDLR